MYFFSLSLLSLPFLTTALYYYYNHHQHFHHHHHRFMPSFMRLGTWNVVMFVSFEQLKRLSSSVKQQHQLAKKDGSGVLELPAVVTTVVTTLPKASVL